MTLLDSESRDEKTRCPSVSLSAHDSSLTSSIAARWEEKQEEKEYVYNVIIRIYILSMGRESIISTDHPSR